MEPFEMTASAAARAIRDGRLTSEELVRSCLERTEAREPEVKAWLHLDPRRSIEWAREMDKRPITSPVHGIPFGVKDMIDTVDMPTSHNSPIFADHRPAKDAACVSVMKSCGAVLMGKTDTVEFASFGRKAATRNPARLTHTPGGSSSGSGAAVGDFQVPLAFGTQTGGSLIRPASFNGICALKPTWGAVSREGAKQYSPSYDTVGWYGREVADLALVAAAFRLEGMDSDPGPIAVTDIRVGVCKSPVWHAIEPAGEKALATAADRLARAGAKVFDFELPRDHDVVFDQHDVILRGEGRSSFLNLYLAEGHRLHEGLASHCEENKGVTMQDVVRAYDAVDACRIRFGSFFADMDVILTPASPGFAPEGLHTTGNHIFNSIWTAMHAPCLAMPSIRAENGLPVGVQFVAPRYRDADLIRLCAALEPALTGAGKA